jgi:hypothetical protein
MVSIFAETVFTDTQTVTLSDGVDVDVELNNEFNPPNFIDISSTLGGFAYIETVEMTFQFDPPLQFRGFNFFNGDNFNAEIKPFARFKGDLDLFSEVNFTTLFSEIASGVDTTEPIYERIFTVDSYVDTPLEIKYGIDIGGEGDTPEVEGTQTLDINTSLSMIGRQP